MTHFRSYSRCSTVNPRNPVKVNPEEICKMKNSVHSWVHTFKETWHLGARGMWGRGLSDCVEGSCKEWNHARCPRLAWAGWRRHSISAFCLFIVLYKGSAVIIYLFSSAPHTYIIKFSTYLFSEVLFLWSFRVFFWFINPDSRGLTVHDISKYRRQ
jgi:hypothetical protein